jgi:putative redox protein
MEAIAKWDHGLTFQASASSDFSVALGAEREAGGDDDGFRPIELMLVSLAGCTGMDVVSILRKKRQELTGFEVHVQGERANDHPKVFTAISVKYVVRGRNIDAAAIERAMQLSRDKYCPVQAMLGKVVPIHLAYEIIEE